MVDTVVDLGDFIIFNVGKGNGGNGEERVRVDGEDGEGLVGVGDVGIVDVFREFHDHELADRVHDIDAIGDTFIVEGETAVRDRGNCSCRRCQVEDKGGGDGGARAKGGGGGGDIVHDVLRGGSEFKVSNFKGHKIVAGELGKWMIEATLYLYSVGDDQSGCVGGSKNDA